MSTQLVNEGQTKLEVPELERFRTRAGDYAPSLTRVFYNPHMEFCRDLSVSAVQALARELGDLCLCDPLAGVGVRGLRYAKEVKGVTRVIVNDRSLEAVKFIRRNIELNELGGVEVHNEDANTLLWRRAPRFHFVDLDPFGSPASFIDAACASLLRRGMLALTATDTAPLSGTHAKACIRRYGAKPLKTEYGRELGVRILIGFCQRAAGKYELAFTPVLAHATRHYFRVYLRGRRRAGATNDVLANQGYVSHCRACGHRSLISVGRMINDLARRNFRLGQQELTLLNLCREETDGPPAFYDMHELSGRMKVSSPKIVELIGKLRKQGYFASRTHFSGTGFRTDAPMGEIIKIFKCA
ncbi:MAG: hypothetical protein AVW05_01675 [Hadesarchaea archaeon DG-33]|nr:MAG: hypothetical protein AVW05_01675 [Hadesarchaea archaeon DG-33]